jgi:hypothetical protein
MERNKFSLELTELMKGHAKTGEQYVDIIYELIKQAVCLLEALVEGKEGYEKILIELIEKYAKCIREKGNDGRNNQDNGSS